MKSSKTKLMVNLVIIIKPVLIILLTTKMKADQFSNKKMTRNKCQTNKNKILIHSLTINVISEII